MPAQISDVLHRAQVILQDVLGTRWDEPELLNWFSDGRREIATVRPTEFSKRVAIPLARGALQAVPEEAFQLIRVDCNVTVGGVRTAGRAVTPVERRILDAMEPAWQDATRVPFTTVARHYAYDLNEPMAFYVYPGNTGQGAVEATIAVLPADAEAANEPLGVRAVFANALLDYVLYRAFSKDADHTANMARAREHYGNFAALVGVPGAVEPHTTPAGGA
jgi:hypothetical protein